MKYDFPDAGILLFAREPVAGLTKTRLAASLGAQAAVDLYQQLFSRTAKTALQGQLAKVELWVAGNPRHLLFASLFAPQQIHEQKGKDLGLRMSAAARDGLTRYGAILLIGADCPSIDTDYLRLALQSLASDNTLVLGPAEDGGYVLLGMRRWSAELFNNIEWGSSRVLQQTLAAAQLGGYKVTQLETRWDVDRPEDLSRLASLSPPIDW